MAGLAFDPGRLAALRAAMTGFVDRAEVPGLVWLVARGGTVETGAAGVLDLESGSPAQVDSIFRISSRPNRSRRRRRRSWWTRAG